MEDLELLADVAEDKAELKRELSRIARKNKLKRKMITMAMVCVLFIVALTLMWFNANKRADEKFQTQIDELKLLIEEKNKEIDKLKETPIVVNPIAPEIVLDMVNSEMGEIGELATIEYLFTNAAKFSDQKMVRDKWKIPGTQKSFILKWDGKIKAGVDLEKVSFDIKENSIIVTVPNAEIMSYETDAVEVMDEKNSVFNPITVEDKVDFDAKTEEAMKKRAIENGLLEKAQASAEDIITRLLTANSELKDFTIEFVIIN